MAGVKIDIDISMDADKVASEVDKVNKAIDGLNTTSKKTNTTQESGADSVTKAIKKETEAIDEASRAQQKAAKEQEKTARAQKKAVEDQIKAVKVSVSTTADAAVSTTKSAFSSIRDIALGTLTALGLDELFGNVSDSLNTAISDASSIVESENLLRATFNQGADSMLNWADASATDYGLTNIEAKKYLSFITGVLNNTGVANDALEDMTTNYVRVVGDLASAFNTETSDAFEAIRSGIAGNTTAMQRYGVVLSVANLQQFLNEKGITATYKTLDAASKQYVRYAYIMQSTADIQGDYTNTFDSFANSVKTLKGEWQNFLALVGQYAIPLLQPVIQTLATMIAYAKAVVEYLAELFGLEKYTSASMDYSYLALQNTEDTADAQNDVTDAVKATNKEMKKGVKLLDLYTLDFTDSSSKTGTTAKADTAAIADDLKSLTEGIQYNIPEFVLPEIKVDEGKVQEIGDAIYNAFKTLENVWNGIIKPFVITPVENWLNDDLGGKIETALNVALAALGVKFFLPKLSKLATNLGTKLSPTIKSVFGTLGGIAIAGIGSWSLGKAMANSVTSGELDLGNAVTGMINTLSGIAMAFALGGPIGGTITVALSAILGMISYNMQLYENYAESAEKAIDTALEGTVSIGDYFESLPTVQNLEKMEKATENLDAAQDNLNTTIDTTISNLDKLRDSDFELPEGLSKTEYVSQQMETLNTDVNDFIETTAKPIADTFAQSLTGPGGLLESTNLTYDSLRKMYAAALDLEAQDISGITRQLEELYSKSSPTAEDLARIEELQNRLSSLSSKDKSLDAVAELSKIDYTNADVVLEEANKIQARYQAETDSQIAFFEQRKKVAEAAEDSALVNFWDTQISLAESQQKKIDAQLTDSVNTIQGGFFRRLDEAMAGIVANYVIDVKADTNLTLGTLGFDIDKFKEQLDATLGGRTAEEYALTELGLSKEEVTALAENGTLDAFIVWTYNFSTRLKHGRADEGFLTKLGRFFLEDTSKVNALKDRIKEMGANYGYIITFDENEGWDFERSVNLSDSLSWSTDWNETDEQDVRNLEATLKRANKLVSERASELAKEDAKDAIDSASDELKSDTSTEKIQTAAEDGLSEALKGIETPEEAKTKGTDLANAITGGMTAGFDTALAPGSDFMNAANSLTETLKGIPNAFDSAFKSAINNISTYINTLVNNLKTQTSSLSLPEGDVTLSALYKAITTSNFKIPQLADGGVIPANNPFLAVLGDQRRGVNIEAPVTVIQDAVRDVIRDADPQTPVEVKVYIGDREIRDFVVDTITANNLIVG